MATLQTLNFDNSYLTLPSGFYQKIKPTPLETPFMIAFDPEVAQALDLDPCGINPSEISRYLSGHELFPGSEPIAMKYTGHQFGVYNPELGDGRGLLLGEVVNRSGVRWDLHLKGAGKTAFSRFGDGRAVLRSSIREYLVGIAMQGLNIPTTRALAIVGSEEVAMREGMMEPCAAVLRVTQCHIRFGHFEYLYYTRQHDALKELADYCIERFFPEFIAAENPYAAMFEEVLKRSADLVAHWQAYGFVHAVMNTDNMSLIGETFDYGPYSFLDRYDPTYISNHNDHQGRYAFAQQPAVMHWNLSCLGQALLPLIEREEVVTLLDSFPERYGLAELAVYRRRLGLQQAQLEDAELIQQLIRVFTLHKLDMHRFFRALSEFTTYAQLPAYLQELSEHYAELSEWLKQYEQRLQSEVASVPIRQAQMRAVNPVFVLRNYMAEEAIQAAHKGDFEPIHNLQMILRQPMQEAADFQRYAEAPPEWAGGICLTCSS